MRTPHGMEILGTVGPHELVLTPEALEFVAVLERRFRAERAALLAARCHRQALLDAGDRPHFLPENETVRMGSWRIEPVPEDLADRRVEITGPVDRKMIVNALNSGAKVFMADFEDATSPTWDNIMAGQANLFDAVRRQIDFVHPVTGKEYRLREKTATLMVRPRGWHLPEQHVLLDGVPVSASLFDFSLYFFHNALELLARGTGPYFYLPKLESHREALLWNDVFIAAPKELGIPRGTIKATVLIETITAAFEMDEILFQLREHSAGLNCGRWDYIFSFIKKFRNDPAFVLPDRDQVTMGRHFLSSYSRLLIKTCHRRGAHAIGGMAAQVPIKGDEARNRRAIAKVRADKEREARYGHDGTWVAHPGLVRVACEEFDVVMPGPNQIHRLLDDVHVTAADLLHVPQGTITEAGLRTNLRIGVQYLEAWLRGQGCVLLNGLMEDTATAEISRSQVWQWRKHGAQLADGRTVDYALVRRTLAEEVGAIEGGLGAKRLGNGRFAEAAALFERLVMSPEFTDFLTLPAHTRILDPVAKPRREKTA